MSNGGAVVIGAGPAGLASAAELRRRGVPAVVLERADGVAASWRGRYDRLRLNTSRWFSRLPGGSYARGTGIFPSRDEVVRYLEDYATRQRPRRAPEHRGAAHRPRRRGLGRADVGCGLHGRARGRRGRLRAHPARPGLARPRALPRVAAARGRLPQPRALPRPRRPRGRPGLLGHGDRLRPRRGRGATGAGSRCAPRRTCSCARRWGPPSRSCSCACDRSGPTGSSTSCAPRRSAT